MTALRLRRAASSLVSLRLRALRRGRRRRPLPPTRLPGRPLASAVRPRAGPGSCSRWGSWPTRRTPSGSSCTLRPGSSHWSVVTPEGVADNGGIVAGVSPISVDVGHPAERPAALLAAGPEHRRRPDVEPGLSPRCPRRAPRRPRVRTTRRRAALAVVGRSVLSARRASRRGHASCPPGGDGAPRCGATAIDAVAVTPDGVADGRDRLSRDGRVGLFTARAGTWRRPAPMLAAGWRSVDRRSFAWSRPASRHGAGRRHRRRPALARGALAGGRGPWTESAAAAAAERLDRRPPRWTPAAVAWRCSGPGGVVPSTRSSPGPAWARLPSPPRGSVGRGRRAPQTASAAVALRRLHRDGRAARCVHD